MLIETSTMQTLVKWNVTFYLVYTGCRNTHFHVSGINDSYSIEYNMMLPWGHQYMYFLKNLKARYLCCWVNSTIGLKYTWPTIVFF